VPIKVGWLFVELVDLRQVDAVFTPRHLDNDPG
jgi:hypothetical protein